MIVADKIFGITNLNPNKSGLGVIIWAEHGGVSRNKSDHVPRVMIGNNDDQIAVSIEAEPQVIAHNNWRSRYNHDMVKKLLKGIDYVGRNYEIFLAHYNDTDFSFDDEALFDALRAKHEYK